MTRHILRYEMENIYERFHLLLFSIKDSIFPIHMIGKFCYKEDKRWVLTYFINRKFHVFNRKFHVRNRKFPFFNRKFCFFLIENFMFLIINFMFLIANFEILIVILMQLMQNTTRWSFLHQLYFCAAPLCQCKLMQICINFFEPVTFKVGPATLKRFRSSPS